MPKIFSQTGTAIVFLLFSLPSGAQTVAQDLTAVQGTLKAGDTIWVSENMKPEITGQIVDLDSSVWVLETRDGRRELPARDIVRVRQRHADSLWNGGVIGGAIALAPWIAWCAPMTESGETCSANATTGLGVAAAGAFLGVLLDASKNSLRTIYLRPDTRRRGKLLGIASSMTVAPILTAHGKGARLSVVF